MEYGIVYLLTNPYMSGLEGHFLSEIYDETYPLEE